MIADSSETMGVVAGILAVCAVYGTFGIVCAVMAPGRGRGAVGWFFIGVATQCLGIVLLLVLPNLKEEEAKQRRREEDQRRLREQLKKERQIADERHGLHRVRLDVHDRALGLDTTPAEAAAQLPDAPPPLPALPAQPAPPPEPQWYHAQGGTRQGPVPRTQLRTLWHAGQLDGDTLVWRQGMADWAPFASVREQILDPADLRPDATKDTP